jgi:hypothetical protein
MKKWISLIILAVAIIIVGIGFIPISATGTYGSLCQQIETYDCQIMNPLCGDYIYDPAYPCGFMLVNVSGGQELVYKPIGHMGDGCCNITMGACSRIISVACTENISTTHRLFW